MVQAARHFGVLAAPELQAPLVGLAHERDGRVVQAEAGVHGAHRVHEGGLDRGLVRQLAVDPLCTLVQDLAGRDLVTQRLARVGHLEQVDHEPGGLPCRFGLGLGSHALPFRLVAGEPGRACKRRRDRHAADGGRDQPHHASLSPMGLALLEFVEPDAQHAGDQLQLAVELAVLARPDVGRNRFRRLLGQLAVRTHAQDERRREAFLVRRRGLADAPGSPSTMRAKIRFDLPSRLKVLISSLTQRDFADLREQMTSWHADCSSAAVRMSPRFVAVASSSRSRKTGASRWGTGPNSVSRPTSRSGQPVGFERLVQPLRPLLVGVAVADEGPVLELLLRTHRQRAIEVVASASAGQFEPVGSPCAVIIPIIPRMARYPLPVRRGTQGVPGRYWALDDVAQ